jgi:dephospho-CoA kinase
MQFTQSADRQPQRRIGLTGGIATGKTTVADYLADRLPILDADRYAHEAVAPGSPVLAQIVDRYGSQMLLPVDGAAGPLSEGSAALPHLDRRRLGDLVFGNPAERQWLEALIHPIVAERFDQALAELAAVPVVLLVIPLLFEAQLTHRVTEIWVVSCSPQEQLDRLMARNHWTQDQAQARIAAQMPLSEKCARADVVLINSGSRASLLDQVDRALG